MSENPVPGRSALLSPPPAVGIACTYREIRAILEARDARARADRLGTHPVKATPPR